jgi:hypothetical protein
MEYLARFNGATAPRQVHPSNRTRRPAAGISALGQEETSLSIGRWRSLATDATLGFQRTINRTIALGGFKPPPWT